MKELLSRREQGVWKKLVPRNFLPANIDSGRQAGKGEVPKVYQGIAYDDQMGLLPEITKYMICLFRMTVKTLCLHRSG